jgi:oligoendopeptidase F
MSYPQIDPLDWRTVRPEVERLLAAELGPGQVDGWLQEWSGLAAVLAESALGIQRAVSENTADREAEARFLRLIEEILPQQRVAEQALRDKLLAVRAYRPSQETASLYRRFAAEADLFRPENVPIETELARLGNDYDKIAGRQAIDWDGTRETMPQAELHLLDPDRDLRERAWRLIMARWQDDRTALNGIYTHMLALRRQTARNAGKPNYRAYSWEARQRFDYTPQDCLAFHDAIECEVVPLARALRGARAARLGLSSLRPWDTEVDPYGAPLYPFANVNELEDGAGRIFGRVDPILAGHFALMRDDWLDLASRPNKAPGGYCEGFPVSGRPYIFMNAAGTHDNVQTLLHEGGHAFHFMESSQNHALVWNHNAPMEFCEVASMGMELLGAPYLERGRGGFYDDPADARRAYAGHLEGIVQFLPYMAVVDAFQHWVYTEAPEDVTPDRLDARWRALWDRFMPGIDYEGLEDVKESGWHRKLHIFRFPFYYVEYGLAQLGALQIWRNALRDERAAVTAYRRALAQGYTRSLPELFAAAGARFAFDRAAVGELMQLIGEQLAVLRGEG